MKKFIKVTILLVLLTLMLVSSCLVGFAKEKVFTISRNIDIIYLDPYDTNFIANVIFDYMIYDRLVDLNPETGTDFIPALATEWQISPDSKEYTFKLRKGVKFTNGEPFNAESVKVSLERFLHEKTLRKAFLWEGLKEVEIVDDYTVIIKFNKPNVLCLNVLTQTSMLPPKAFTEKGVALFDNPIGTGPFTWDHWTIGQEIVVNKKPDYWGKPVYIDKFIYRPILENTTRLAGILTGEIDVTDKMYVDQIPLVESSGKVEVVKILAWDQVYIALKTDKPPFTDIKFRQAMDLSIDKEGIVNHLVKGGRVATGFTPKGIFGFDDTAVPVKRDVEKAKQLVKESIYDGRTLNFMIPIGWFPLYKEVAQAIQGEFKEVGINVELEILDEAAFMDKRAMGEYDMFLNNDETFGDSDPLLQRLFYLDVHKMGNINPELKKLIEDESKEVDRQKREEILKNINNMIMADFAPLIMVYQIEGIYFQQKGITGIRYYGNLAPDCRYVNYEK